MQSHYPHHPLRPRQRAPGTAAQRPRPKSLMARGALRPDGALRDDARRLVAR